MTHQRAPERVAPPTRPEPGRNGPGLFHVLEDTGVGPVRERPVKE
ncbi:hypothetical protein ACWED2_43740 [Amycolatopsis sp. NPDC005003]